MKYESQTWIFAGCARVPKRLILAGFGAMLLASVSSTPAADAQTNLPAPLAIHWDKTLIVSKSTPTLQVVVNPMTAPGSPIHDATFQALKDLQADYVRYVPWLPYPQWAVAEITAPTKEKTSWNFTAIDPMTKDFLTATEGHPTVMNFSTIPAWLFKTEKPVSYPTDPAKPVWDYTQGTELVDPSGKALGDYFSRLVSWYTKGGFTDENGGEHKSGYHYEFPIWEILNEPDFEHVTTPKQYTERYDIIAAAIHKVSPDTKFMGMAMAMPGKQPEYFEYFLNPKNHKPGITLDYVSYHFYASPTPGQTIDDWQFTFFDQADGFLDKVRYIESIRKRLSPSTKVDLDELGVILADGIGNPDGEVPYKPYPKAYWNLAGSMYAYLYVELAKQGIDIIGESQLVGYPTQFPSVSMMDWETAKPNARFWVLKLLKDNFHPGDKLVDTSISGLISNDMTAQAFETPQGKKLLLLNKRGKSIELPLPSEAATATALSVDEKSGEGPARSVKIEVGKITLDPYAVTVISW